jgi:endonuclease YncB( thermonuclease family)
MMPVRKKEELPMVKRLCSPMAFMITMLAVTLPAFTDSFAGKVVSVTDGDTIQVMHDGKAEKIRLHGVASMLQLTLKTRTGMGERLQT